ncbi:hypothetical protein DOZ80_14000 [Pseudomonas fluorescens]|uniref:DUF4224 domain-containing protein n=1 Tax=Pseudomonas fluorescens TaxID=294 RepID=A0A327N1W8_PSEFL|nr:DUF4224 domain-containing protein [Pseudomonas fluorescens]RAI69267.1 hypothetical protein DOZ80_14000 [Pseudomonas fluorescens]
MSSIEFLTHEQVCELTAARTKAGQLAVLRKNGVRHTIKRNGWPCVTTSALLDPKQSQSSEPGSWKPRKAI